MLMSVVELYERKREHFPTSRWKSKETFHSGESRQKRLAKGLSASRSAARVVARHCCMTDRSASIVQRPGAKTSLSEHILMPCMKEISEIACSERQEREP